MTWQEEGYELLRGPAAAGRSVHRQGKERGVGRSLPTALTKDRAAAGAVSTHDRPQAEQRRGSREGAGSGRSGLEMEPRLPAPSLGHLVCGTRPAPFRLGLTQRVAPSEGLNKALCMGCRPAENPLAIGHYREMPPSTQLISFSQHRRLIFFSFPFYRPIVTLLTQNSSVLSQWSPSEQLTRTDLGGYTS